MKRIISFTIMSIIVLVAGCATIEKAHETEISYVENIPSQTKEKIFNGAKVWIAQTFRSAKAVIEYENEKEGVLIGNGSESYPCFVGCGNKGSTSVSYTMRIDIKDQKVKLSFFNIKTAHPENGVPYSRRDEEGIRTRLLGYGKMLRDSINKDSKSNDW